jgi:hypothetical protein
MTTKFPVPIESVINGLEERGVKVSPLIPKANWIELSGQFTPFELRALADYVEENFNGNKKRHHN